jgi:AAA domain-containing protein
VNGDSNSLPSLISSRLGLNSVPLSPHNDFQIYKMDLSRLLYFSGMDDIRYVEFPEELMEPEEGCLAFSELVTKFKWWLQIKIVLLPSDSAELTQRLHALENVIVISPADLERVAESKNVTQPLRELFRSQLSPNRLVGYQYNGAVTGNRFFGRESQLAAIIQRPDSSYLVTGTRMSGKTSLLMEAKRKLEDISACDSSTRPNKVYVDCKRYATFAGLINAILTEMEERTSFSNIERWESPQRWHMFYSYLRRFASGHPDKRLHLFLDEYDQVLEIEKKNDPRVTWNFRALYQANSNDKGKGIIQFVIAGSKDLAIKAAQRESTFYNFVEDCRLSNFDLGTISALLQRPMEDLGFKISDPPLIAQQLLRESAGRPSSVQFICYHLVKRLLEAKKKIITVAELREVVQGPKYLQYYDITLHENTDVLQRFILATQSKGEERKITFSRDDILRQLEGFGVYLDTAKLIHSLEDLVNSGFLVHDEQSAGELRYVLSIPVIKRIFRPSSLESFVKLMLNQHIVFRLEGENANP